jgi:hypothetical protein
MTMNCIVLSRCIGFVELFIHQLVVGNAGNRQRFHENLLSGFGRRQSRCQITNPSIPPQARGELYEYSGVIWIQRLHEFCGSSAA